MNPATWVIMPTYNERENLDAIVRATASELERVAPHDHRILIVDDNSPDGTGKLADRLAEEFDQVEVLHRERKAGLGKAYVAGFTRALAEGAERVIEMDADFSHDPAYLEAMLEAAAEADLVVGSRYVDGGGVRNWNLLRRIVSRGGGIYARTILGVSVHDLTAGFKCISRDVLEAIDISSLRSDGYVFQIEVTYRALRLGFDVREVPIVFCDRAQGKSKMSTRIALEAMWVVPAIRRGATDVLERSPQPGLAPPAGRSP